MTGKWRFLVGGLALIIITGAALAIGLIISQGARTLSMDSGDSFNEPPIDELDDSGAGGMGYDNETADSGVERSAMGSELPWEFAVLLFFVGSSAALLVLFARIRPDDVLEGPRKAIYEHIERNPGDHLASITKAVGMSSSSVRHHLEVLEWGELIVSHKGEKMKHYYPNRNGYRTYTGGDKYKEIMAALRNRTSRDIIKFIMTNERANQQEIASALGIHPSTVNWHANRLISAGVLKKSREGKDIHYGISMEIDMARLISLIEGDALIMAPGTESLEGAST